MSFGFRLSTSGVTLDILLAPGAATVSGTVRDGQGRPLDEVPVTIWTKADGLRGFARTTISEQDGSYKLTNLPPGEYWVAAWQGISAGIAEYRGFFESFGKGAKPVKLAAGARLETDLTAIGEKAAAEQAGKLQ